ncbi:hypothetical protein K438DRAFT_2059253 [Mycena galopus ATCC 62051]|nr:hypothetical protein K438DRAFT_1776475 [Mycena galopus ATCC 62051]KAF8175307.1 hypothetical protein K438DRAFT_1771248 [Mycena galopus ATCC 62051]KAF8210059.1 hypothetical protein K438DRAFT_2059253 [Mycena galopus ATCC 62051]
MDKEQPNRAADKSCESSNGGVEYKVKLRRLIDHEDVEAGGSNDGKDRVSLRKMVGTCWYSPTTHGGWQGHGRTSFYRGTPRVDMRCPVSYREQPIAATFVRHWKIYRDNEVNTQPFRLAKTFRISNLHIEIHIGREQGDSCQIADRPPHQPINRCSEKGTVNNTRVVRKNERELAVASNTAGTGIYVSMAHRRTDVMNADDWDSVLVWYRKWVHTPEVSRATGILPMLYRSPAQIICDEMSCREANALLDSDPISLQYTEILNAGLYTLGASEC